MTRIIWITDPHLNFVRPLAVREFLDDVAEREPAAVLIGGDIGEAHNVVAYLEQVDELWQRPVHFVLGNHDFYRGSIAGVRREIDRLCERRPLLNYLSHRGVVELTSKLGLVGHDGWADARVGDYEHSYIMMNDYKLIAELSPHSKEQRWPVLRSLGDAAAAHIRHVLPQALKRFDDVLLLTHVPPLRAACWHEGRPSDDEWSPHFVCQAVGEAILEIMTSAPTKRLTVLCGHTHSGGETDPLPNVHIVTGPAAYGFPAITREFEFE